jgi:hypothetical protein
MKFRISLLAIVSLLVFITFGCEDDNLENNYNTKKTNNFLSESQIEIIADKHNQAMNKVISGLKENDANQNSIVEIINNQLNEYYRKNLSTDNEISSAIEYSEESVDSIINLDDNSQYNNKSPIKIIIDKYSEDLNATQIDLLNQIDRTIDNSMSDFENAITNLNNIENDAINNLTKEQAQPIIAGTKVGKASLRYWKNNHEEWKQAITNNNFQLKDDWFDWNDVEGADVAGGVGGAVGAAVVNLLPGAGQVSYVGAILGGAAAGSATSAVNQVWDYVFD